MHLNETCCDRGVKIDLMHAHNILMLGDALSSLLFNRTLVGATRNFN
jgi:hypothetical protein